MLEWYLPQMKGQRLAQAQVWSLEFLQLGLWWQGTYTGKGYKLFQN